MGKQFGKKCTTLHEVEHVYYGYSIVASLLIVSGMGLGTYLKHFHPNHWCYLATPAVNRLMDVHQRTGPFISRDLAETEGVS